MGLASPSLWAHLQGSAVFLFVICHLSVRVDIVRASTPKCQNGLCTAHGHTVEKRSSAGGIVYTHWTQWSACSLQGDSTRDRTCSIGCSASSTFQQQHRPCSAGTVVTTAARTPKPTDSNGNTDAKSPRPTTTRPITINNDHTSPAAVKTSPPRKPVTIRPPPLPTANTSETGSATHRAPWLPSTPSRGDVTDAQTIGDQTKVTTRQHGPRVVPTSSSVTTSGRTDNYNLRITVAISSALVGSLLLVAVVACWRRLHLEQQEQRRQLMQPEATQPEYHGLPGPRQTTFPAPPPNYHDAFQIDSQQIQAAAPPALSSSTSGSNLPGTVSQSDGPVVHPSLLPPPFVPIAPAAPWPTQSRPLPPPAPPSSPTASSTGSGGCGTGSVVAAREKSHVTYIVSHLKSAVTADESIEEEETSLDIDMLLGGSSPA